MKQTIRLFCPLLQSDPVLMSLRLMLRSNDRLLRGVCRNNRVRLKGLHPGRRTIDRVVREGGLTGYTRMRWGSSSVLRDWLELDETV